MKNPHKRQVKDVDNSGFSPNSAAEGSRLVNKDGSNNLRKVGAGIIERFSFYHTLLKMSGTTFCYGCSYIIQLRIFCLLFVYLSIGIEKLQGVDVSTDFITNFTQAFFFSSQTMTTVGYGHVAPSGFIANAIASIESF